MGQKKLAFAIHSYGVYSADINTPSMDIVLPDKLVRCVSISDFQSSVRAVNIGAKKVVPKSHFKGSFQQLGLHSLY